MYAHRLLFAFPIACFINAPSHSSLIHFTSKTDWEAATVKYSTITFTELPINTQVTTQYSELGIIFTPWAFIFHTSAAVNDDFGLHGPNGIHFTFDTPKHAVAIDHPGLAQFQLFFEGELIAMSELMGFSGTGNFSGLVSSNAFDEVLIFKPWPFGPNILIDDLHWSAIPAPGVGAGLLAWFAIGRRRRRQCA